MVIVGTIRTVFTFGTPVAFGTLRIGSVFSTLAISTSEFWYIVQVIAQSTGKIQLFPVWKSKRPPSWNYTSGFDFDHITVLGMSLCIRLSNFIRIGPL